MVDYIRQRKISWFTPKKELTRKDGVDAAYVYLQNSVAPKLSENVPWFIVGFIVGATVFINSFWNKYF